MALKTKEEIDNGNIKVLSAPVTINSWLDQDRAAQEEEKIKESIFDLTKEKITVNFN